jgi:putative transposase
MCEVLGVSSSGFYDWLRRSKSKQALKRESLTQEIKKVYNESRKTYGSPKITESLKKMGNVVSQKTVARIMNENGIASITVRKFKATTNSNHKLPVYPNILNQQFTTQGPGEVWVADITYIDTKEGWVYLASIMDLYSRRIIGFHLSNRMTKDLVILALERAIMNQPPRVGLIHHSDQGSQYASNEYQELLKKYDITASMSRKGNCYDNASIESFHSILKKELIYQEEYATRERSYMSIFEYITCFYNTKRIHSGIGYATPVEMEAMAN